MRQDQQANRIDSIRVVHETDVNADTSFIGEYTDNSSAWAIDRESGEYVADLEKADENWEPRRRNGEYRFFVPYGGGEKPGTDDHRKYGLEDFRRMERLASGDLCFLGIQARADIVVNGTCQTITSGGLWGIESDSGDDYFAEVGRTEVAELAGILETLGFSRVQVAVAMGEVGEPAHA
jgi:hypothetical protein